MPDSGRSDSAQAATTAADPIHHRVKRGETIYSIAHAFKTSVGAIQASNPFLSERPLEAGDVLTIDR
jgi:LysM repeat protein